MSMTAVASDPPPSVEAAEAVYLKRALMTGKVVDYPDRSVVVVGDVPRGANISAGGDISILGKYVCTYC
jgi:septum formation inhibitor MinC